MSTPPAFKSTLIIGSIFCRAVILFPLALVWHVLVLAYLTMIPAALLFLAFGKSDWWTLGLIPWLISLHVLRKPLAACFRTEG